MTAAVLVHGFLTEDGGAASVDCLMPHLAGCFKEFLQADYGKIGLLKTRFCNSSIAKTIAGMTPIGSVAIGHSNGATIIAEAMANGARFSRIYLINPALDADFKFEPGYDHIFVLYNPTDNVVRLSRWRLWHDWGDLGASGYRGQSDRVTSFNLYKLGYVGHTGHKEDPTALAEWIKAKEVEFNG